MLKRAMSASTMLKPPLIPPSDRIDAFPKRVFRPRTLARGIETKIRVKRIVVMKTYRARPFSKSLYDT